MEKQAGCLIFVSEQCSASPLSSQLSIILDFLILAVGPNSRPFQNNSRLLTRMNAYSNLCCGSTRRTYSPPQSSSKDQQDTLWEGLTLVFLNIWEGNQGFQQSWSLNQMGVKIHTEGRHYHLSMGSVSPDHRNVLHRGGCPYLSPDSDLVLVY